ncbi:hypothetical protein WBP06_09010 [Novosphingobium sp. BL-8H]|uniref:hypothetical protein n=1 Tax=Novosphingobium sp. BL-8H TaxID=3127640 RepID=UPI003756819B
MKAARAGVSLASLLLLTATGCSELKPAADLGSCWNVNSSISGPVQGQAVLVSGVDGLSLQAPGCDDHSGRNRFELSRDATAALSGVLAGHPRFVTFRFSGHILPRSGHKSLWIGNLTNAAASNSGPKWMPALQ